MIADYLPGLWDQHGKGWKGGGALDGLFGVRHDTEMTARDIFQQKLWVEVDQEKNYRSKDFQEFLTRDNTCIRHASGYNKAVRDMGVEFEKASGRGKASLMNLSPQWYNAYRAQGREAAGRREIFMKHVRNAGLRRWVKIEGDPAEIHGYEITYWSKDGRTVLFVCLDPEENGLKSREVSVHLKFTEAVKEGGTLGLTGSA